MSFFIYCAMSEIDRLTSDVAKSCMLKINILNENSEGAVKGEGVWGRALWYQRFGSMRKPRENVRFHVKCKTNNGKKSTKRKIDTNTSCRLPNKAPRHYFARDVPPISRAVPMSAFSYKSYLDDQNEITTTKITNIGQSVEQFHNLCQTRRL